MADQNQPGQRPETREQARKAFRREHHDIWREIAGDEAKIKTARAILARCDTIRDRLVAHYGRQRDQWIAREVNSLSAEKTKPELALKPEGASLSQRDIENEAIRRVADRQRAKLRSLNDRERRMLYRRVLGREPEPRRRAAPSRGYRTSEKNERILDAVDRAKALRERVRQQFNASRTDRIKRAESQGVENPSEAVRMAEARRLQRVDRAERNVISQAIHAPNFNRAARNGSGPSMTG